MPSASIAPARADSTPAPSVTADIIRLLSLEIAQLERELFNEEGDDIARAFRLGHNTAQQKTIQRLRALQEMMRGGA
jgi:hypothetical protein